MLMSSKAKSRVYGKKSRKAENLEDAFGALSLSPAQEKLEKKERNASRLPLAPLSHNNASQGLIRGDKSTQKNDNDVPSQISASVSPKIPQKRPSRFPKKPANVLERSTEIENVTISPPSKEVATLTTLDHVKDGIRNFEQQCHFWAKNFDILKIAHGSYAAIFRMQLRAEPAKYVIGKLMPLKPKSGKGSRAADQTSIEDAATEVKALDAMSEIPGFVGFSEAWVLKGALPRLFKQQYENWATTHPDDGFTDYKMDQLWCFVEMSDAGTDLEQLMAKGFPNGERLHKPRDGQRLTVAQCWDIFWGTAEALGRGEEFANFEHRDLHPGNVCVKKAKTSTHSADETPIRKKCTNLEVTLIDYTLSRATLADGEILANRMKDRSIFEQRKRNPRSQQDQNDNQQYEMYRKMRKLVARDKAGTKNEIETWTAMVPETNILWLYHILTILMKDTEVRSNADAWERALKAKFDKNRPAIHSCNGPLTDADRVDQVEEWKLWCALSELIDCLDPDQAGGPEFWSAKELLQCPLYWTFEYFESIFGDGRSLDQAEEQRQAGFDTQQHRLL